MAIIFLGTLGLTGINVVSEQVKGKLKSNALDLLTSDLAISARRELTPEELTTIEKIMQQFPHERTKVVDVYSMVRHEVNFQTRLVEVRAVEDAFPYYGRVTMENGEKYQHQGLVISKELSLLWKIQVGDEMKLGEKKYPVLGIIREDTSVGMRGFSLAPRVYLPLRELQETGLLKPGATGSFAHHFRFSSPVDGEKLKHDLLERVRDRAVKVTLPEESSEQSGRILNYLTDFMSLAALIGLLLALVGVFYLYQSHLTARLKDLCLFHLLGMDKKHIIYGMLTQFTVIFVLVCCFEALALLPLFRMLMPYLSEALGIELGSELHLSSVLGQLPFLYALVLTILIPLLMGLLRTEMGLQLKANKVALGKFRFYDFIPFALALWGFAFYLSHSFKTGTIFFACLMLIFCLSAVVVHGLQVLLKRLTFGRTLRNPSVESGVAMRNLMRSGHKLTLSFLSLAMGATLISLVLQLDRLIQKEFTLDEKKPSLFLFDIQEDQLDELQAFTNGRNLTLEAVTPMIRARLERKNGEAFVRAETGSMQTREEENEGRMRNRGVNLTYRKQLSHAETLTDGRPFPNVFDEKRPGEISLEKRYAQRLGIKLGDRLSFDVQGVEIEGVVTSFREVKWTSFYPNFFVNFEPGVIDGAPKTFLAVLPQVPGEVKASYQRDSIDKFPNVSFVDVEELMTKLANLFMKSRQAMELISWMSLGVGLVILYGLSHDQVYRRTYDLALMKTLGFSPGKLLKELLIEFGSLFFLAMSVGFVLGWAMAQAIGIEVFKLSLSIDWERMIYPGIFLSVLCLGTILISSRKAVRAKPRELLSDT